MANGAEEGALRGRCEEVKVVRWFIQVDGDQRQGNRVAAQSLAMAAMATRLEAAALRL
jgi:hypothetical protein